MATYVLVRLFGIAEHHLGKLAAAGHVTRAGKGQWDLWASVRGYVAYLQGRVESGRRAPQKHTLDLAEAKVRETQARAERLAMANARLRGESVLVDDIMRAFTGCFTAARERILNSSLLAEEKEQLLNDLRGVFDRAALDHERNGDGAATPGFDPHPAAEAELPAVGG